MYNIQTREYRCRDCIHCNITDKKCYPESKDCRSEYDLTDDDINEYTTDRCDFYKRESDH